MTKEQIVIDEEKAMLNYQQKLALIPLEFKNRIGYGLYGGRGQYYIKGVDGTLAQLGDFLPPTGKLQRIIDHADAQHKILMDNFMKNRF